MQVVALCRKEGRQLKRSNLLLDQCIASWQAEVNTARREATELGERLTVINDEVTRLPRDATVCSRRASSAFTTHPALPR